MNRQKVFRTLAFVLAGVLLMTSFLTIYLLIKQRDELGATIEKAVQSHVNGIEDGYTPIKGIDYFDGKNATPLQIENAVNEYMSVNPPKDGVSGKDATDEQVDESVKEHLEASPPKQGRTPIIQCNEKKNRWEVRYSLDDVWQLLGGQSVKCTVVEERD